MSLNAAVNSATSGSAASIVARAPGRSGSTPRITAVSRPSGRERPPQQHQVQRQHRGQPAGQRDQLGERDREAHRQPATAPAPAWPPRAPRRSSRTPSTAASCRGQESNASRRFPQRPRVVPIQLDHGSVAKLLQQREPGDTRLTREIAPATSTARRARVRPRRTDEWGHAAGNPETEIRSVRDRARAIAPPAGAVVRPGADTLLLQLRQPQTPAPLHQQLSTRLRISSS